MMKLTVAFRNSTNAPRKNMGIANEAKYVSVEGNVKLRASDMYSREPDKQI
jgi:hypothetical protein